MNRNRKIKKKLLEDLALEVKNCHRCRLFKQARNSVPGEGSSEAEVMFIGEGPGKREDETGKPFVGAAGKFLETLLESIGLKREQVFIGNVVKHRPPNNRDPLADEIKACTPYLDRQIKIIKPRLIVTLGRFPTEYILWQMNKPFEKITLARGNIYEGLLFGLQVKVMPTYHPAAGLYSGKYKKAIIEDFKKIRLIDDSKNT